jgi:hypothetical protein
MNAGFATVFQCRDLLDMKINSAYSLFVEKEGGSLCRAVAPGAAPIMEVDGYDRKYHG